MNDGSGTRLFERERFGDVDIAAKEDALVRADLAFSASIHDAEAAGTEAIRRVISGVRPVLIGAGLLVAVGVGVASVRRSPGRRRTQRRPELPSAASWSSLGRAVAIAFAAAAGKRLVESWLRSKAVATRDAKVTRARHQR
jgi:hypothetical protein